jgi:hypothetical protein
MTFCRDFVPAGFDNIRIRVIILRLISQDCDMKTGLYKAGKRKGSKRAWLFLKVFLATLILGVLGVFVAPRANRLMSKIFPAKAVVSLKGAAPEQVFKDVPVENADARAIQVLKNDDVINGFDDGTFRPDDKIKREEFTKLVVTAMKASPHMLSNSHCFSDVGSEWFAPYVCYAKKKQYAGGYEDGSFGSGKTITVSEGISMLNKTFGSALTAGSLQANEELTRGTAAGLLAKAMRLVR